MVSLVGALGAFLALENCAVGLFALHHFSYNIPCVVLRFSGNKQRPTLILTKAKKRTDKGVTKLWVKGYRDAMRDFRNENYYPTVKGKFGGLILWEFEDGMLTPAVPESSEVDPAVLKDIDEAIALLQNSQGVKFKYVDRLHHQLKLKAIDDVDSEWAIQEHVRIDNQYTGWRDFLAKYATPITFVLLGCLALAGWVVFLKEQPNLVSQCYGAGKEGVSAVLKAYAAQSGAPGG